MIYFLFQIRAKMKCDFALKINLLLFFLTTALILSCNNGPTLPDNVKVDLLPLKMGNYWIYNIGIKDAYNDTTLSLKDTLHVIEENEKGFLLQSRLQIILRNGYYKNGNDGLYLNDSLQFKYPGNAGDLSGPIGLGNVFDFNDNPPIGIISRTDFKYTYTTTSGVITLTDCYYYFLVAFYPSEEIKKTGYTAFKPGVGLVLRDWVDINEITNDFYNPYAALIDYHLE